MSVLRVGFTGTRHGMSDAQLETMNRQICDKIGTPFVGHHGGCEGADLQFDAWCERAHQFVVVHPGYGKHQSPPDKTLLFRFYRHVREPERHFARNRRIVDETHALIAAPETTENPGHGGTWYTIEYARKLGKPLLLIWPSGEWDAENWIVHRRTV